VHTWLSSSLRRFYPASPAEDSQTLTLEAARGERVSFQAVCRIGAREQRMTASTSAPAELKVLIRRVGYIPLPHHSTETPLEELDGVGHIPGYVPDPLLPDLEFLAGPYETHAFWITVTVPLEAKPGRYPVAVTVVAGEEHVTVTATVNVRRAVLPARRDFPVTHWFYADALCDWYKVQPFDQAFWHVLDPYLANVVAHGQDTLYVPMFTPPLDGVKRPTQLLDVRHTNGRYQFDWSLVQRWISAAQSHGISRFEWTHLFTQWGARHAIRIYEGRAETGALLWPPETGATSEQYREFLGQFLPQFERFLRTEGLVERSFFHLSDEPHGAEHLANYREARDLLSELAPWMQVMDALSEIRFAHEGLTDTPIPITATAPDFVRAGLPAWVYFCCGPRGRYLNRLLDTPLVKVRMSGWLFYRNQARGFLHWGYNYWYKRQTTDLIDPYVVSDGLSWPDWASGDPFQVYPGPDGPVDSLRWEIFAESLQDYALLQASGLPIDDPALVEIHDYADFPRDASWIALRRSELLDMLDRR
jgi:hypothetical protein